MAEVWEGRDEVLGRAIAVKVLQSHLSGDAVFVERFRREAITAAAVSSPSIVATYDAGLDDGTAYIVMELVAGRTLRQLLDGSGPLEVGLVVEIGAQIAEALGRAHRAGLVHRDVKPANVLVCEDEGAVRVKVTDFGIAKARAGLGADLTQTGTVLGTPKYLSPEQIQGRPDVDGRSDLYSLGVVMFEALTGRVPFTGRSDMTVALSHLHDPPPRVRSIRPAVPAALDELVTALLSKDPGDRPATATEVRDALLAGDRVGHRAPERPERAGTGRVGALAGAGMRDAAEPTVPGRRLVSPGSTGPGSDSPSDREARTRGPGRGSPRRHRRRRLGAGSVVGVVALAAVVVGGLLLVGSRPAKRSASGAPDVGIRTVQVYLEVTGDPPDDPQGARLTFDGNPRTSWWTDRYLGPDKAHFGGLYSGEGLEIHLDRSARLRRLVVTSSTRGWAASTYVGDHQVPSGSPLSAWGRPTSSRSGLRGAASFSLGGRRGDWVLLWLTDLGPAGRANVAELRVLASGWVGGRGWGRG